MGTGHPDLTPKRGSFRHEPTMDDLSSVKSGMGAPDARPKEMLWTVERAWAKSDKPALPEHASPLDCKCHRQGDDGLTTLLVLEGMALSFRQSRGGDVDEP